MFEHSYARKCQSCGKTFLAPMKGCKKCDNCVTPEILMKRRASSWDGDDNRLGTEPFMSSIVQSSLVRNPHSLDGLGIRAGERVLITRQEYDRMRDSRSLAWKEHARRVWLSNG